MSADERWDFLIERGIASEETLQVITSINGYSLGTLNDVLYTVTGYRTMDQYKEAEGVN